jgi:anti-anti-sigma factor
MSGVEPGQELTVNIRREARSAVIELAGELDLHESRRLSAAVAEILSERVELVELDATALTFIDSAGLRAILLARAGAAEQGVTFLISGVSPQIRRVMEIAGAEDLLPDD